MTTETHDKGSELTELLKDRWYPRTLHVAPVEIGDHTWQLIITKRMEIGFYKEVIEKNDIDPFWQSFDRDYEPYFTVPSIADNLLPPELSAVVVMRRIFERLIGMIHQYRLRFFYFQPGSGRKARFFLSVFRHYIPQLRGRWTYQMMENTYYFSQTEDPRLN